MQIGRNSIFHLSFFFYFIFRCSWIDIVGYRYVDTCFLLNELHISSIIHCLIIILTLMSKTCAKHESCWKRAANTTLVSNSDCSSLAVLLLQGQVRCWCPLPLSEVGKSPVQCSATVGDFALTLLLLSFPQTGRKHTRTTGKLHSESDCWVLLVDAWIS